MSVAMMWPRLIEQLATAHPNTCIAVTDFLLFPGDEEHLQNRAAVDHTDGGDFAGAASQSRSSELRHLSNLTKELEGRGWGKTENKKSEKQSLKQNKGLEGWLLAGG